MSGFRRALASICLTVLRMALCVWVGAAALFVITSIFEQTSPEFGSQIRDQLATIRFPLYYQFGFAALGTALASGFLAVLLYQGPQRSRILVALAFAVLSLAGAAADYQWVYRPLQSLIIPPGKARDQQFITLHERSRDINAAHIAMAAIAALVACAPAHAAGNSSRSRQSPG